MGAASGDLMKGYSAGIEEAFLGGEKLTTMLETKNFFDCLELGAILGGVVKRVLKFDGITAPQNLANACIDGKNILPSMAKLNKMTSLNQMAIGGGITKNFQKKK